MANIGIFAFYRQIIATVPNRRATFRTYRATFYRATFQTSHNGDTKLRQLVYFELCSWTSIPFKLPVGFGYSMNVLVDRIPKLAIIVPAPGYLSLKTAEA